MTEKYYLASNELGASARVTAIIEGERPVVRLSRTVFHAQGGGQRGDRGRIDHVEVLDARHTDGGEVDHLVADVGGLSVGQEVWMEVDGAHRAQGARLHTAGHLVAVAVTQLRPGLQAVSGHHFPGEARVEFIGDLEVGPSFAQQLRDLLDRIVKSALPVRMVGDPYRDRMIAIGDYPPVGCGGTHVGCTSELADLEVAGIRVKSGRLRISYRLGGPA